MAVLKPYNVTATDRSGRRFTATVYARSKADAERVLQTEYDYKLSNVRAK